MITLTEKQKQWAWFIGLWCAGLFVVTSVGYLIKFLIFLI
jgi:hypothetical protein